MNSKRLLDFYLARGGPEAQRWNLSPENLAAELSCRTLVRKWVKPKMGFAALNVGIGVGEWDDFLGFWLEGRGKLTSIDDDQGVCDVFRYRQRRERHPNPSRVLCRDLLAQRPAVGAFDLVTLIGSTASETGGFRAAVAAGLRLLKPGGRLFCLGFHRQCRPGDFRGAVRRSGGRIVNFYESRRPPPAHFVFMAHHQERPRRVSRRLWIGRERLPRLRPYRPDARLRKVLQDTGFPLREIQRLPSLERTLATMQWAHMQWRYDGSKDPGTSNPIAILQRAANGERFRCVEYSIVAVAAARAVGLKARIVGLLRADVESAQRNAGHVVAEVFVREFDKWVMLDPQWDRMPAISGRPLNAAEFARACRSGKSVTFLNADARGMGDPKYLRWVAPYLFYITLRVDQRFERPVCSPDRIILVPRRAKVPRNFQRNPLLGIVHPVSSARAIY